MRKKLLVLVGGSGDNLDQRIFFLRPGPWPDSASYGQPFCTEPPARPEPSARTESSTRTEPSARTKPSTRTERSARTKPSTRTERSPEQSAPPSSPCRSSRWRCCPPSTFNALSQQEVEQSTQQASEEAEQAKKLASQSNNAAAAQPLAARNAAAAAAAAANGNRVMPQQQPQLLPVMEQQPQPRCFSGRWRRSRCRSLC